MGAAEAAAEAADDVGRTTAGLGEGELLEDERRRRVLRERRCADRLDEEERREDAEEELDVDDDEDEDDGFLLFRSLRRMRKLFD